MRSGKPTTYVGIDQDLNGGMTDTGRIIRDAWAFGLIPESETCAGWNAHGIERLWEQTVTEWSKYNHRVADLPEEIRTKYLRIQSEAMDRARREGWDTALKDDD